MKNRKYVFLLIILTSILFITVYLNINIFKKMKVINSSNIKLKETIKNKDSVKILSYSNFIEYLKREDVIVKSFEKNEKGEILFDIIYRGNIKEFRDVLNNVRNSRYKYEFIKINMDFKENKEESFIKFKIYPMSVDN